MKTKNLQLSFVDFYKENKISPVNQNIANINKHFSRRNSLYYALGIVPSFVKHLSFLEFGPGSGHNSLHTASLTPKNYTLVEGNPFGFKKTKKLLSNKKFPFVKILHKLFLKFSSSKKYDIVWAEGCIPHQKNPKQILLHLKNFTKKNGVFVCTTANGVSYLSEILRRLLADLILDSKKETIKQLDAKIKILYPIFNYHLSFLENKSRNTRDWILDSIIHPLENSSLFSIIDAINYLNNDFIFYNSSPRFVEDWRWYKSIIGPNTTSNDGAINNYYKKNLNLLDRRFLFKENSEEFGKELENLCETAWVLMCKIQKTKYANDWKDFFKCLKSIEKLILKKAPDTALSINVALKVMERLNFKNSKSKAFASWWGRGQQYASFLRTC